jgi:hypothetical protein
MKPLQLTFGLILAGYGASALACDYPALAQMPATNLDGGRAQKKVDDDMLRYIEDMRKYVDCITAEYSDAQDGGATKMHLSLLVMRNNAAVSELGLVRKVYEARVQSVDDLLGSNGIITEEGARRCIPAGPGFSYQITTDQQVVMQSREGYFKVTLSSCPRITKSTGLDFGHGTQDYGAQLCVGGPVLIGNAQCNITTPFYEITQTEADELRGR